MIVLTQAHVTLIQKQMLTMALASTLTVASIQQLVTMMKTHFATMAHVRTQVVLTLALVTSIRTPRAMTVLVSSSSTALALAEAHSSKMPVATASSQTLLLQKHLHIRVHFKTGLFLQVSRQLRLKFLVHKVGAAVATTAYRVDLVRG